MNRTLGTLARNIQPAYDRNIRADRGRSIRYRASRIILGETPRNILSNEDVTKLAQRTFHEAYGGLQAPTVEIALDGGQSKKAAENWWKGANPPGLEAFVNAYRNNARFAAFARYYLLGHQENDPILEIQLATAMSNIDQAAARLGMPSAQFAAACGFARTNAITEETLAMGDSDEVAGGDVDVLTGDLFEAKGNA